MKPSIWYDVEQQQPAKSGYYIAFKGYSMGDNETGTGYYFWNAHEQHWQEHNINSHYANVRYWCDADPAVWYEEDSSLRQAGFRKSKPKRTMTLAEQDAWQAVKRAVEQYEIVKALTQ